MVRLQIPYRGLVGLAHLPTSHLVGAKVVDGRHRLYPGRLQQLLPSLGGALYRSLVARPRGTAPVAGRRPWPFVTLQPIILAVRAFHDLMLMGASTWITTFKSALTDTYLDAVMSRKRATSRIPWYELLYGNYRLIHNSAFLGKAAYCCKDLRRWRVLRRVPRAIEARAQRFASTTPATSPRIPTQSRRAIAMQNTRILFGCFGSVSGV